MERVVAWLELPEDIWKNILNRLDATDILKSAQKVCTTWRRLFKDPSMWRVINLSKFVNFCNFSLEFKEMCHQAIDLSQGELVDIRLAFYSINRLLLYVSERSPKLERLSIEGCYPGLSPEVFVEAVQKLPLLEELRVTYIVITTECIEALGRYCPRLKSFEVENIYANIHDTKRNDKEALAIAKNLPALHHLQLIRNNMTNEGLQAILDGCPNLVSLDLRQCKHISLNEVLINRISRQIKHVKYPTGSRYF